MELSRKRLGLRTGAGVDVRAGDARMLVGSLHRSRYDVVLGDAFGGLAVPWHLTTVELAEALRAILRPSGVYVVNVIDYPPMRFARAEAATLQKVFGHVAVIAHPESIRGDAGANFVLAASSEPLDAGAIAAHVAARAGQEEVLAGAAAGGIRRQRSGSYRRPRPRGPVAGPSALESVLD